MRLVPLQNRFYNPNFIRYVGEVTFNGPPDAEEAGYYEFYVNLGDGGSLRYMETVREATEHDISSNVIGSTAEAQDQICDDAHNQIHKSHREVIRSIEEALS